jgi:uncharacterized surface protein with fasciclin (FAS1) repeats
MNINYLISRSRSLMLAMAVILLGFSACNRDEEATPAQQNIVETARADNQLSTFVTAVQAAGLQDALSANGPFTVFAPTNQAFDRFLNDQGLTLNQVTSNTTLLQAILSYHVVQGRVTSGQINPGTVSTLEGNNLNLSTPNNRVYLNGVAEVTTADINATNGVIHKIDYVITPPEGTIAEIVASNDDFSELLLAVQRVSTETPIDAATLLGGNDSFTVFAPTNAAFRNLYQALGVTGINQIPIQTLTEVLTYHVVAGTVFSVDLVDGAVPTLNGDTIDIDAGNGQVNDASIVEANTLASNGVIHAIDEVLIP